MTSLMPIEASEQAVRTDQIYYILLAFSGVIVTLVLALVIVFAIRYRRGSRAPRGELPSLMRREFEIGWTSATLFLAFFIFWWTASVSLSDFIPPRNALEVHVVAKQWMWKTEQASGVREINALHVPIGTPVKLIMTSQDVIHSFYVPAFRMKKDVVPGRYTQTWFKATKLGTFQLLCAEYCGTQHSGMTGRIVVMQPDDYTTWLAAQPHSHDPARAGATLFRAEGCAGCHTTGAKTRAPSLVDLYGRSVKLADGRTVTADDRYIHDSLLKPGQDVVAGFEPIMPSYEAELDEDQIASLIAYLRSPEFGKEQQP
jgi:cytochrome c oxidase subunit 2